MNKLWYGDNLTIMQNMRKYSVDLIYLDPPFNSKQNYNLLYKTMTGKPVPEQVEAFCDTWEMDAQKEAIARSMPVLMREHGVDDYYVDFWRLWMQALRNTQPHLLAYLIFMVQRLLHMKSLLRPTGSIYLHCDPTASHYIKVMMDGIFGHENFRNEIIWKRTSAHNSAKRWGPVHDVILFYTASDKYTWNKVYQAYDEGYVEAFYKHKDDKGRLYQVGDLTGAGIRNGESGAPWRGVDPTAKGRHWAPPRRFPGGDMVPKPVLEALDYLDEIGRISWPKNSGVPRFKRFLEDMEGVQIQDIIDDISPIAAHGKERLGYPTQKPVALLDRIIKASTNKGDVVFDPFCGCGTTIYSSVRNQRQWIGCDIAILSIKLVKEVLTETYRLVEGSDFDVDGVPTSVEGAQELFDKDPSTFQNWFVERVGGFPMQRKSADRGIDGRIYFETKDGLREMMLQVKGGKHVRPTDVRDLRGVLEREENAMMAGFLSITPPTKAMLSEAAEAGVYEYNGVKYPRIQFLTTEDVLVSKREFHMPTRVNTKISTGQQSLAL
ncbi:MAG: site-specific DNA-methyltransferase [Alphaproteobacteria bacterium]|nr:site-specific DNA-methyltransferase [Alphaproteobacteria bacterium]